MGGKFAEYASNTTFFYDPDHTGSPRVPAGPDGSTVATGRYFPLFEIQK